MAFLKVDKTWLKGVEREAVKASELRAALGVFPGIDDEAWMFTWVKQGLIEGTDYDRKWPDGQMTTLVAVEAAEKIADSFGANYDHRDYWLSIGEPRGAGGPKVPAKITQPQFDFSSPIVPRLDAPQPGDETRIAPLPAMMTAGVMTMSSLEIAELVEARHDSVKRTIERLASQEVIGLPPMVEVSNPGRGPKFISVYQVGKRDSYVIVAQLSPEFTARLVDRWQELEDRAAKPAFDPNDPRALRNLLVDYTQRVELLEADNAKLVAANDSMTADVDALKQIADSTGLFLAWEAAKHCGVGPIWFTKWLRDNGWIWKDEKRVVPMQIKIDCGFMRGKLKAVDDGSGRIMTYTRGYFTSAGVSHLAKHPDIVAERESRKMLGKAA